MADRHSRSFRPSLRPDKALYQRVAAKIRRAGSTMNEEFENWLRYMDGETDEPPERPGSTGSAEARPAD